jgi:hypothetical protein
MSYQLDTPFLSKQIFLNSDDTNSTKIGNADIEWDLRDYISVPPSHHIILSLDTISIPLSYYNINSTNNTLDYTDPNSVLQSLTITAGNYTVTTLVTFFNANLVDITASYSYVTNKLTFTSTVGDFTFEQESTCFSLLGFTLDSDHTSTSNTLIADQILNLVYSTGIYVDMNDIVTENLDGSSGENTSILARIPINQTYNTVLQYQAFNHNVGLLNKQIKKIHITLKNDARGVLALQENAVWSLVLTVHFITQKKLSIDNTLLEQIRKAYSIPSEIPPPIAPIVEERKPLTSRQQKSKRKKKR